MIRKAPTYLSVLLAAAALSPLHAQAETEETVKTEFVTQTKSEHYILSEAKYLEKVEEASRKAKKEFASDVIHSQLTLLQYLINDEGYSYDIASQGIEKANLNFNINAQKRIDYYFNQAKKESKILSETDLLRNLVYEGYIHSDNWETEDYGDLVWELVMDDTIKLEYDTARDYPNLTEARKKELLTLATNVGQNRTSLFRLLDILADEYGLNEEEIKYLNYNLLWDDYIITMNRINQIRRDEDTWYSVYSLTEKLLAEGHPYEYIRGALQNAGITDLYEIMEWPYWQATQAVQELREAGYSSNEELLEKLETSGFTRDVYWPIVMGYEKYNTWVLADYSNWYYLDGEGDVETGWMKVGNTWYYMNTIGRMQTDWIKVGNTWYYLKENGAMQTGWTKVGNTWYYMTGSGAMQTGWTKVGNTWYYMNSSGAMQTGWTKAGNTWYYMNSSGAMQTGWLKLGRNWYYLNSNGAMQTQNTTINGTWYRFDSSGRML